MKHSRYQCCGSGSALILLIWSSDADPGSGAFLTPGSGIRNRFFPDPGSQTHIFQGLVTIFWVKTSIILGKLGHIFFFSISKIKQYGIQFCEICGYKKCFDKKKLFTPVFCCCFWIRDPRSGIRDPGWVKIRNRDPG